MSTYKRLQLDLLNVTVPLQKRCVYVLWGAQSGDPHLNVYPLLQTVVSNAAEIAHGLREGLEYIQKGRERLGMGYHLHRQETSSMLDTDLPV